MKIDPNVQFPADNQPEKVRPSRTSNARVNGGSSVPANRMFSSIGEDTVSISSAHGELQALTADFTNVPEVRIDRVGALQPQVSTGQYQPDSGKIADALIADQSRRAPVA